MENELSSEPDSYDNHQTDNHQTDSHQTDNHQTEENWAISNLLSLGNLLILVRCDRSMSSPNIFCADGGGIRGYWSLLALQKLMEYIADEEQRFDNDREILHSFHPQPWPEHVSHIPLSAIDELERIEKAGDSNQKCRAMFKARRFLPCHYFDHICGSSTGA